MLYSFHKPKKKHSLIFNSLSTRETLVAITSFPRKPQTDTKTCAAKDTRLPDRPYESAPQTSLSENETRQIPSDPMSFA